MCGLVFVCRQNDKGVAKMVRKRFNRQKSRGVNGFGFISIDKNGCITKWGRSEGEHEIMRQLSENDNPMILFHHRTPTSTPNVVEATHPIKVSNDLLDYDYYMIHNGIISNDDELKGKHEEMGFSYSTEMINKIKTKERIIHDSISYNDSESLAIELALVIDGEKTECEAKGSIAFIMLQVVKNSDQVKNVFWGRNYANPLKMKFEGGGLVLTSEGDGDDIKINTLYQYNLESGDITEKEMLIKGYVYPESKSTYPYNHDYTGSMSKYDKDYDFSQLGNDDDDFDGYYGRNKNPAGFRDISDVVKTPTIYLPEAQDDGFDDEDYDYADIYAELIEKRAELEDQLESALSYYPAQAPEISAINREIEDLSNSIELMEKEGYKIMSEREIEEINRISEEKESSLFVSSHNE